MALRQLILTKTIAGLAAKLEELRAKDAGFAERRAALDVREAELMASVEETTDETSEEDRRVVEDAVADFESDQATLAEEQSGHETDKTRLEEEIQRLNSELEELNKKAAPPPLSAGAASQEERRESNSMEKRMRFFGGVEIEFRQAIFAREDVKAFVARARELIGKTRAVSGGELNIPDVLLGVLRDTLHTYSKLISRVRKVRVPGKSRQNIAGQIPEGVWTEACAKLNELEISFSQIEVDGYKVGGYVAVCNALLEDSDVNLVDEIMYNIAQAIGFAVDKAILYGTGVKMPLGIVKRLAQAAEPDNWGDNAPTWTDLSTTNLLKINPASMTAEAFFAALILNLGKVKANYTSTGQKWWAMNSKTFAALQAKAIVFNAAGAIVSGQNQTMPIVGGEVVLLEFIPDNDIVGGYGELYLLAERAGAQLAQSEHVRFIEDQTVVKGTARYDGKPVFGEGFVAVNIANANPTTTIAFASDTANP